MEFTIGLTKPGQSVFLKILITTRGLYVAGIPKLMGLGIPAFFFIKQTSEKQNENKYRNDYKNTKTCI